MPPFDRVVELHGTTVLRVCRALLDPTDADDAWSETFLAALVAWPDLPPDVNVEAWLVTVARRKALDVIRARGRRPQPVEHLPESGADGDSSSAAFDEVLARDDALLRAVRSLPEGQRDAVVLHHLAGLSHLEVAELTGRSHAACRRSAADGVAALRNVLGERDERGSTPALPTRPTGPTGSTAVRPEAPRPAAPRRTRPREGARP
ncbi:sigma-70 family RNA polymerase sigma factor [Frigoribacterium sp. CFBP 13729]|jgi:RNA polymerase sigma factor (sigma-70 family)|uniref:RNA polymerase sigma factor n=1 Tax=Frigoribacterium sp. CFBP 13729 TaxID=2775293 RepID=UPI00177C848A|nr:sigma-70 family RNA polymerase sigma factor [Frigoribacterium sp. CFBP 13729]MBD8609924.1 sigma-70 family RNA polymerase sigma factor [Frigoribacterium sp. CFBP 13729]